MLIAVAGQDSHGQGARGLVGREKLSQHVVARRAADTVEETGTVGNLYVNRSMIGAIVGSQPFGGEGLSGTGPKAGGPHYLPRFCAERVTSTDTTSSGGNATLLSLEDVGL